MRGRPGKCCEDLLIADHRKQWTEARWTCDVTLFEVEPCQQTHNKVGVVGRGREPGFQKPVIDMDKNVLFCVFNATNLWPFSSPTEHLSCQSPPQPLILKFAFWPSQTTLASGKVLLVQLSGPHFSSDHRLLPTRVLPSQKYLRHAEDGNDISDNCSRTA